MVKQSQLIRQTASALLLCGLSASLLSGFAAAQELSTSLPGGLSIATFQEIPSYYTKDWRDDPGLWGSNPEMRKQAWVLAAAGLDKALGSINTTKVLQNLRTAQEKTGNRRGCFWWNWKDGKVTDTNAGFFVTMGLLTLAHTGEGQLNQEQRELLDKLLSEARYWFDRETADLEGNLRYPNKCLGDVVCMWLLAERFDAPTPKQHKILDRTLAYYRDSDWGWGEHMSDIYARVIQDELLALYMWGASATAGQKQAAWDLFLELVAIDDVFDKGPRVPAIRSYSATRSPSNTPYRERLTPWTGPEDNMWQPLRAMACQNGIPALLPEQPEPPRHTEIACYGGARALVTRSDTWRLGAMSRYQIMDGIDHPGWGLAWQSMPVAYWRNKGDWGFLQWESVVNGSSTRMHPQSYGDYPKSLADSGPGMIGQTYSVRRGDGYVVLRRCSRSSQWTSFKDRFRLIKTSTTPSTRKSGDWSIMDLDYGSGEGLRLQFLPLVGRGSQTLLKNKYDGYDWEYSYGLAGEAFAALWVIMPLAGDSAPPAVDRNGGTVSLRWTDGDLHHLDIDLASSDPMKVMEAAVPVN